MLVPSKEALKGLHSTDNLMNRLSSRRSAMGLFGVGSQHTDNNTQTNGTPSIPTASVALSIPVPASVPGFNPFPKASTSIEKAKESDTPDASNNADTNPTLDKLVNDSDTQIKLATAHNEALGVLVDSIKEVKLRLPEIKADRLPGVIAATSKVVEQIQRQRMDANKGRENQTVHLHFYTPVQRRAEEYEVIDVG